MSPKASSPVEGTDQDTRLAQLMSLPHVDHQALANPVLKSVLNRTHLGQLLASESFSLNDGLNLLEDELFSSLLSRTILASAPLERFLTRLREMMLEARVQEELYVRPMALQCWNNQYIWGQTEPEARQLDDLVEDHPLRACYRPHHLVPGYLRKRFLEEPAEERMLAKGIPRLAGQTFGAALPVVAEHYGKHPYPRYLGFSPPTKTTLDADFRNRFPWAQLQLASEPRILIAGCGTGRHALRTACRYGTGVTALDLSLQSLAYGARMARTLGIQGVQFVQGDLLQVERLEQTFDLVECVGVLHHLAEPAAGLDALTRILRPGGVMRLGLYSKRARGCVAEARALATQGGFTADSVRDFRQTLLSLPPSHPAHPVTRYEDFYSTSGVLDLLFHPQEHTFDLEEIRVLLAESGLEFLGFESLPPGVQKAYTRLFPTDKEKRNWQFWKAFEHLYPRTFRSMYQFWCYKKTP